MRSPATPSSGDRPVGPGVHAGHPGGADRRRGPSPDSACGPWLGIVGLTMVAGYLGERLVRQRLRPAGWDALESPLIIAALGLAVAMAAPGNLRLAAGTDPEHPLVAGS
jgi:hypothetical protein